MMRTCWFDASGQLINIGEWDYGIQQVEESEGVYEEHVSNPLPDGAYSEEREVVQDADGGLSVEGLGKPKSEIELLKEENASLTVQMIDLYEILIVQGVI